MRLVMNKVIRIKSFEKKKQMHNAQCLHVAIMQLDKDFQTFERWG